MVRRFAVAIVSANYSSNVADEIVWNMAERLADAEPKSGGNK